MPAPPEDHEPPGDTEAFEQALSVSGTEHYLLRLYVAGDSLRSRHAIENIRRICDEFLHDRCEVEVIDIYTTRTVVPEDMIVAAPTLIRRLPLPLRQVIGDLSERERVLVALELNPES
jgi:circadian clock protein KaiB